MADYKKLAEGIQRRLNPDNIILEKAFSDELSSISYSDVLTYVRLAMKGVEPAYTQKSKEAGERVKEHLKPIPSVIFKYQGSVMTNTHIKGNSDIDLLTISDKSYSWDREGIEIILNSHIEKSKYNYTAISRLEESVNNFTPYIGSQLDDLRAVRIGCEDILRNIYSRFDASNAKAIKIKNLSLNRDVDIVAACWYDNALSIINGMGDYRGIQVYDKNQHEKLPVDYPFLSIKYINERGSETEGRLKRMIRFLKNVKAYSNIDLNLSSFDINAICYDISTSEYMSQTYIELVWTLYKQLKSICTNKNHSDNLLSVDGREYIFKDRPQKLADLRQILSEVQSIYIDLFLKRKV